MDATQETFPRSATTTAGAPVGAMFRATLVVTRGSRSYVEAGTVRKGRRATDALLHVRSDHMAVVGIVPRYIMMVAGRKRSLNVGSEHNLHCGDPTRTVRIRIDLLERLC